MEIFILRDGEQTGPFNEDTVQSLFQRGSLTISDMAWRKGLPAWMPLGEVLHPGSEKPSQPPPTQSGIRSAPKKGANAKQKALLTFIGANFSEDISREEAALMISDAMENPKLTSRLQKWTEEKLRLHPDLFQEELDQRRAHRVLRYLERCQTEASEAVKEVTKAHVQVLVESLDKRTPTWEHDPKAALWDQLLPAIAEHFPQLIHEGWKDKLKYGGSKSKVAEAMAGDELPPAPAAPGVLTAAVRGLVIGGVALALILGGKYLLDNHSGSNTKPGDSGKPSAAAGHSTVPAPNESSAPAAASPPGHPTTAPLIAANPTENAAPAPAPNAEANAAAAPDAAAPPASAPAIGVPAAPAPAEAPAVDPKMTAPAASAPGEAPAPANPTTPLGTPPAPAPPGAEAPAVPTAASPTPAAPGAETPAATATAAGFKNILTVTKPVAVQLQFGKVTLNVGTRVRFIALEGPNVRVNFNNNVILVPAIATDVDPSALPPAPAVPSLPPPTLAPTPATVVPPKPAAPTPSKPSSDL